MRIYHIISSLDVGGAEVSLKKLVLRKKVDVEVKVIVLNEIGIVGKEIVESGVEVISFPLKNVFSLPLAVYKLSVLLKRGSPDIVHTWLYHADLIGGIAARMAGIKNVIWSIRTTRLKKGSYATAVVRFFLSGLSYVIPKRIVCVAEASLEFHRQLGYSRSKFVVIGNGFAIPPNVVDFEDRKKLLTELNIKPGEKVIGSVGRFSSDKGQDLFVKAAGLLLERYSNLKFIMVGRGNDTGNIELVQLIESTGFPSNFILLGEQSNVGRHYALMDVFCLHSRTEGFPNVLGEAMMHQVPCVATRAGDAERILGSTGIVVDGFEPESIAKALSTMLDYSDEKRIELGCMARARMINEYSFDSIVVKYMNLYKSLVSDS